MNARQLTETTRLISEVRATLAAELAKPEPDERVVNSALGNLVKLEVLPALEVLLAAEHAKPQLDREAIVALTDEIQRLHRGELPDHAREQLLASRHPAAFGNDPMKGWRLAK
jgi:hypothetical protein